MLAMTLHGVHISYFLADQGRDWNFHITGAYQQVMAARGMILKECPIQVNSQSHSPYSHSLNPYSAPRCYQGYTFRNS